jgi:hypothetical protein
VSGGPGAEKPCGVCGRTINWMRRYARTWEDVKFCSARCKRVGMGQAEEDLEHAIIDLLDQRTGNQSITPTEAAKLVGGDGWQSLMSHAQTAVVRLAERGEVEITMKGKVVDPSHVDGPVRIRRARVG